MNGLPGQYFAATDEGFRNILIWYDDGSLFIVKSTLDKDEILKVAESIELVEKNEK